MGDRLLLLLTIIVWNGLDQVLAFGVYSSRQKTLVGCLQKRHTTFLGIRQKDDNDDDMFFWEEEEEEEEEEDNDDDDDDDLFGDVGDDGYDYGQLTWEKCWDGTTWVLLPPSYVGKPSAIVHYVGGTLFGSSPKLWYRTLLEGVVKMTQCAIVATAIPVTLLQNPLEHVSLSRKLQKQFQVAYRDVLRDEYEESSLKDVPVVGMGHSLGARLLVVTATLKQQQEDYHSLILMSFTNYGAAEGVIPGIEQLLKERRNLEKRYQKRKNRRFDDDDDWEQLLRKGANRLKDVLTPRSEDLEFYPTPNQLWRAITEFHRYRVPKTLLVQFQDDEVDQSARLARGIGNRTDHLHFARLRGNHLTPVSVVQDDDGDKDESPLAALLAIVPREATTKSRKRLDDLQRSIARYILDVVVVANRN